MLSESARMTSAAEARFRIPEPQPTERTITVAALDPRSNQTVSDLAERAGPGVTCHAASAADRLAHLAESAATTDLVVMVTEAGADAGAAAVFGEACSRRRTPTAAFVMRDADSTDEALSRTLAQVRPWALMVVIASDEGYVEDILRSLR